MATNDITQIINVLAEKLGTTTDQIYSVLLAQAKIYTIKGTVLCLVYTIIITITAILTWEIFLKKSCEIELYNGVKKCTVFTKWIDEDETATYFAVGGAYTVLLIASLILLFVLFGTLSNVVNALLNPHFWALDYILTTIAQ